MSQFAYLVDIAYRSSIKAPMQTKTSTMVTRVAGLDGDARGKPGKRQITLLSQEQWLQTCQTIGADLPWTYRRANLLVSGMLFDANYVGKQIKIGSLVLLVCGETDPCYKMDKQFLGLKSALAPDWRGGVCCQVIADGRINIHDKIRLI